MKEKSLDRRSEIYTKFLDLLCLSKQDFEDLKKTRGFSDETIAKCRFASVCEENSFHETVLRNEFTEHELVSSGLLIVDGNSSRMNPILLDRTRSRIIIPYLDRSGSVYHVRPHKHGFAGIGIEIYQDSFLAGNFGEVVLTEGEFKAAASMQFGVPSLAVPGISSFSEKLYPALSLMLKKNGIKRVIIVFDNEVKDDPSFPDRYKENPGVRYDTQFYAYWMAHRLERDAFEVLIGWLPDAWRTDGKADIDGALVQGRSRQEFLAVLYAAKPRNEFLNAMEPDAKQIVLRKLAKKRFHSHIRREFNKYVVSKQSSRGGEITRDISNFMIEIRFAYQSRDQLRREIQFVNEHGARSVPFIIEPGQMASNDAFREFCLSKGDFFWRGTMEDLSTVWEMECMELDDVRRILESDRIGWIEKDECWLFGNVAITKEGKDVRADENGIFWIGKKGIRAAQLVVGIDEQLPSLSTKKVDLEEIKDKLSDTIGRENAMVCLGWILAVAFMEDVFDAYESFPFLFLNGESRAGKSTVAEWLMNFWGMERSGIQMKDSTSTGIGRALAYFSSLPIFLDEYRNELEIKFKTGFFKNVYNRQSVLKGIKADFGVRGVKIRGTLLLAGEEIPDESALKSRCIEVTVAGKNKTADHYRWFMDHKAGFSWVVYDLLRRKSSVAFIECVTQEKESMDSIVADKRMVINYGIISAACKELLNESGLDITSWIHEEAARAESESREESAVQQFLTDIEYMSKTNQIINESIHKDSAYIYLHFPPIHQEWMKEIRRAGRNGFSRLTIRKGLACHESFMKDSIVRLNDILTRCLIFNRENSPQQLTNICMVKDNLSSPRNYR